MVHAYEMITMQWTIHRVHRSIGKDEQQQQQQQQEERCIFYVNLCYDYFFGYVIRANASYSIRVCFIFQYDSTSCYSKIYYLFCHIFVFPIVFFSLLLFIFVVFILLGFEKFREPCTKDAERRNTETMIPLRRHIVSTHFVSNLVGSFDLLCCCCSCNASN